MVDGSRPFHAYCDAFIELALPLNKRGQLGRCGSSLTSAALPLSGNGLRSTWKLAALSGSSNAFEATSTARSFAPSRTTRWPNALAKWEITMCEPSGGSGFLPYSTTPSSTPRASPTEIPFPVSFARVSHRTPPHYIQPPQPRGRWRKLPHPGLRASHPFRFGPRCCLVLPCVGWCPTPRALFGVGSLSPLPSFAISAHTGHVRGLTTSLLIGRLTARVTAAVTTDDRRPGRGDVSLPPTLI